jgi:hypothetical protein
MKRLHGKLTYSNVVSTLCLLLLVGGGTAWAATTLPKNSVGSKQIKKGAVTAEKLSESAKSAMAGPRGAEGARGPEGPRGADGQRGERGEKGDTGAQGDRGETGAKGESGPKGEKGDKGEKGEKGETGAAATTLFAQVNEDGTLNTGGATVTTVKAAKGVYLVNFGREISQCVVVANQGGIPIFSTPGGATSATNGYGPRVDIVAPKAGANYQPGFPANTTAAISTFSGSEPEDTTFYVAALC